MTREEEIKKEANRVSYNGDEFYSFIQGAEWADKTMIDKVSKWLKENLPNRMYDRNCCLDNFTEYLIEDLRKYLEK